jgi:hypothetical protein
MLEDWKTNGYEPIFDEKENRYKGIKKIDKKELGGIINSKE